MSDNLKAQIERLTAANARLTAGGGAGSGFLAGYYQKHIRTGRYVPLNACAACDGYTFATLWLDVARWLLLVPLTLTLP